MTPSKRARALIAVDFENLLRKIGDPPFSALRGEARDATLRLVTTFRSALEDAGYAVVSTVAFADWEAMPQRAQRMLSLAGVEPIYVAAQQGKSSADIRLSLDVQRRVLLDDDLSHVAIMGGDRDYLPLLEVLRGRERSVTVAALASTLGADLRAYLASWRDASVVELDAWTDLRAQRVAEAPDGTHAHVPPATESPRSETASVESEAEPDDADEIWTPEHVKLLRALVEYRDAGGFAEVHLSPFFRHLRDREPFGPRVGPHPRHLLEDLTTMGVVDVEQRIGRNGGVFSVAILREDRLPAAAE